MQLFSSFWDYIEVMDAKQNYKHEANKKKNYATEYHSTICKRVSARDIVNVEESNRIIETKSRKKKEKNIQKVHKNYSHIL